jgi:hypothetical protein
VARSSSIISFPSYAGTFTEGGRYFATGSLIATSPRSTMAVRISAVNTLVIEAISNAVSPSSFRLSAAPDAP